jgi:tetratricopeptide (TPR) repeat protein
MALDIVNGKLDTNSARGDATQLIKQAQTNIERGRDIFQALPELHAATYLLEASLLSHTGQFSKTIEAIVRFQHSSNKQDRVTLQFIKAKLLFHSGKFTHALSEYEDILEFMEGVVAKQMERNNKDDDRLPVIDGAAALTGVGLTKLMIHHTNPGDEYQVNNTNQSEIIEAVQTATEMLLESRKDAILSAKYSGLALDLGLAAAISLTNFGVVHRLISNKTKQSIMCWKQSLELLDQLLLDSMNSATLIPKDKFQCMQSLRARLYCNLACVLLQLDEEEMMTIDEETLKESSEMAGKALEIYDEILNGPKVALGDDSDSTDADDQSTDETAESPEWNDLLKESPGLGDAEIDESTSTVTEDITLSPLWMDYHRAESARALGLVAICYHHAGAAVTAEGLFQSALDASSSYPFGQCVKGESSGVALKGVSLSSPNLGLIARDVRLEYALLCDSWDKRKSDADKLRLAASKIGAEGVLTGFGNSVFVSGLVSSIWLFSPLDFKR